MEKLNYQSGYEKYLYTGLAGKLMKRNHIHLSSKAPENLNKSILEIGGGAAPHFSFIKLKDVGTKVDIKDVIIEVSSNVVNKAYIKGRTVYVNTFYVNRDADNTIDSPGRVISREIRDASQVVILSPKDLEVDLVLIRDLIKEKFHPEARLHVIPPLNLRTGGDNSHYIRTRAANTYALEAACNQYKINFYNVGKHLEDVCINPTLEKFQPTRAHYDEDLFAEYVRPYLEEQIKPL